MIYQQSQFCNFIQIVLKLMSRDPIYNKWAYVISVAAIMWTNNNRIESIKTTSMEDVSKRVLEKMKNI